jgi:hypothetical protein
LLEVRKKATAARARKVRIASSYPDRALVQRDWIESYWAVACGVNLDAAQSAGPEAGIMCQPDAPRQQKSSVLDNVS